MDVCVLESQRANQKGPLVLISPSFHLKQGLTFAQSCLVEFWKSPRVEIEHPSPSSNFTQCSGDDFLFSWNFSAAAWECCLSSCALLGRVCLCRCCLFHHPKSSIRQISLVVCLFVFLSVLPLLFLYFLSDWQQNLVCIFGLFQRKTLFLFSTLEKRTSEMYEQKKKLGGVSRQVPVPNSCLPNVNVSYFRA